MGTHFITDTRGTTGEYFIQITTKDKKFFQELQEATRKQMDYEKTAKLVEKSFKSEGGY